MRKIVTDEQILAIIKANESFAEQLITGSIICAVNISTKK